MRDKAMKTRIGLRWAFVAIVFGMTIGGSEGAEVRREGDRAMLTWSCAPGESGRLTFDLRPGKAAVRAAGDRRRRLQEDNDPGRGC